MHAGTPLGDPIELGALSSVFHSPERMAPLTLMASKGFLGHTEPAAGVVSLIMATTSLAHSAHFPIMHLRNLNPHVEAILGATPGALALPRATGSLPHAASDAHLCTGISSFAFQGTNAHAVLQASNSSGTMSSAIHATAGVRWQKKRSWVLPQAHCLIKQCLSVGKQGQVTFGINLQHSALAFLWEHQVMERSIFPAAAYAELALTGLRCLLDTSTAAVSLTAVAIPAPMLLALAAAGGGQTITCTINTSSQQISVASSSNSSNASVLHMHSIYALLHQPATPAPQSKSVSVALSKLMLQASDRVHSTNAQQQQQRASSAAAQAEIAPSQADAQQGFWHHPASFDSFLQMGQLFLGTTPGSDPHNPPMDPQQGIHVPAGVECLSLPCRLDTSGPSYGSCQPSGEPLSCNYTLSNAGGQTSCAISGMRAKPLSTPAMPSGTAADSVVNAGLLYETVWVAEELSAGGEQQLRDQGCRHTHSLHPGSKSAAMACANAMAVVQESLAAGPNTALLLQHTGASRSEQSYSADAVAGMLRSAAIECNLSAAVVKTNTGDGVAQTGCMQLLLQQPNSTADVFGRQLSAGISLVPRLLPYRAALIPTPFTMSPQPRGSLTNLKPAAMSAFSMTRLQPGQVLLQVHAVGVNFRDVLNVLGMYPGDPGAPGADCAGIVMAVGAAVKNVLPGQAVFGLAEGSLGSHVVAVAETLVSFTFLPLNSVRGSTLWQLHECMRHGRKSCAGAASPYSQGT